MVGGVDGCRESSPPPSQTEGAIGAAEFMAYPLFVNAAADVFSNGVSRTEDALRRVKSSTCDRKEVHDATEQLLFGGAEAGVNFTKLDRAFHMY